MSFPGVDVLSSSRARPYHLAVGERVRACGLSRIEVAALCDNSCSRIARILDGYLSVEESDAAALITALDASPEMAARIRHAAKVEFLPVVRGDDAWWSTLAVLAARTLPHPVTFLTTPAPGVDPMSWFAQQQAAGLAGRLSADQVLALEALAEFRWRKRVKSAGQPSGAARRRLQRTGRVARVVVPTVSPELSVGVLVHALRSERGWTREYLASRVLLSPSAISRLESEQNLARPAALVALGAVLCDESSPAWVRDRFVPFSGALAARYDPLEGPAASKALRRAFKLGILPSDVVVVLDADPAWEWVMPSVWVRRVRELEAFVVEHGRLPEMERGAGGLSGWVATARVRGAMLCPEQRARLEAVDGWVWAPSVPAVFDSHLRFVSASVAGGVPLSAGWLRWATDHIRRTGSRDPVRVAVLLELLVRDAALLTNGAVRPTGVASPADRRRALTAGLDPDSAEATGGVDADAVDAG